MQCSYTNAAHLVILKVGCWAVELDINLTICIDVPAPNRKSEHAVIYLCVMGVESTILNLFRPYC